MRAHDCGSSAGRTAPSSKCSLRTLSLENLDWLKDHFDLLMKVVGDALESGALMAGSISETILRQHVNLSFRSLPLLAGT